MKTVKPIPRPLRYAALFLACILAGVLLKAAVCALPAGKMHDTIPKSIEQIEENRYMPRKTGKDDQLLSGGECNYLRMSDIAGEFPAFRAAMTNTVRVEQENGETEQRDNTIYWWGAVTVLRPFLIFLTYEQTISLFQLAVFCLMIAVCIRLYRSLGAAVAMLFALSLFLVSLQTAVQTVSTMIPYVLSMAGILLSCRWGTDPKRQCAVLFVLGFLTGYLDWMTTNIITYAYPAITALLLLHKNGTFQKRREPFLFVCKGGALWALSYGLTIVSKWVLTALILREGTILEGFLRALNDITKEGSAVPEKLGDFLYQAALRNVQRLELFNLLPRKADTAVMCLFALLAVAAVAAGWIGKKTMGKCVSSAVGLAGLAPFAWIAVFHGHTYVHYWYTYRMLGAFLFGCAMAFYLLLRSRKEAAAPAKAREKEAAG